MKRFLKIRGAWCRCAASRGCAISGVSSFVSPETPKFTAPQALHPKSAKPISAWT